MLAVQVTLRYSGKSLGRLMLPVQLHVRDGRRLRLDICADCVPASQQAVYLPGAPAPNEDGALALRPVAIGDAQPPMQMFSIWNVGASLMHWSVDEQLLEALKEQNWGCAAL